MNDIGCAVLFQTRGGLLMRFVTKVVGTLVLVTVTLTETPATALPCDNTRWCAQYSGQGGGGTNCGFFTIEQCRATVSGIGGFCVLINFTIRVGPRAAAALGIVTNY